MTKRFAFVIHPISAKDLLRLPIGRALSRVIGLENTAQLISKLVPPFTIYKEIKVTSITGESCEGVLITLPSTPQILKRMTELQITSKLLQCARIAQGLGCTMMGLGAYTSVAGDAGAALAQASPIGITTGNSLTAFAGFQTIKICADKLKVQCQSAPLAIIGATGSIGSAVSKLAAREFRHIMLIAPKQDKLDQLKAQLLQINDSIEVETSTEVTDSIRAARLVFTTTSAAKRVIDLGQLSSGTVVIDVAMPPDVPKEDALRHPSILVVAAGEILLPFGSHFKFNIGLGDREIFACMAETIGLCLEGITTNFTIGRDIKLELIDSISKIAAKHGLVLGPLRTYGVPVADADWYRVLESR